MTTKEKVYNFIQGMKKQRRATFSRAYLVATTNSKQETCMRALRELRKENKVNYAWNQEKNYYKLIK